MSALGRKQISDCRLLMSALPPKADIDERVWHVRFVPVAEVISLRGTGLVSALAFSEGEGWLVDSSRKGFGARARPWEKAA